jgi:hypothetical protein
MGCLRTFMAMRRFHAPKVLASVALTVVALAGCGSDSPETVADAATTTVTVDPDRATDQISLDEEPDGTTVAPDESEPETEATTTSSSTPDDSTSTTTTPDDGTCGPLPNAAWWVDVSFTDPDGGLNLRAEPGISAPIVIALPRGTDVRTLGGCEVIDDRQWWEVVDPDENDIGWVASSFLSAEEIGGGFGTTFSSEEFVGLEAGTVEDLMTAIAQQLGDEDAVQRLVNEPEGVDAQGAVVTFDVLGLKDDSIAGYRIDLNFIFDRDVDDAIIAFRGGTAMLTPFCARGVSADGLCV